MICSECGAVIGLGNAHEFDGHLICDDCFDSCTVTCDNCGERIWRDDAEGDSIVTLCSHCYEYSYTTCEDCGRLIPEHAIRVLIKENKIKHIKVGNRTYINYYSVIEYINNVA